jgi:hypothetical protein
MKNTQAMAALYQMPTETRAAVQESMQQALAVMSLHFRVALLVPLVS